MRTGRMPKSGIIQGIIAVSLVTLLSIIAGCGTQPLGPTDSITGLDRLLQTEALFDGDIFNAADSSLGSDGVLSKQLLEISYDEDAEIVGISGGVVSVELGGSASSLSVPPAALQTPVEITVKALRVKTIFGKITLYDFGPDGLVFLQPATLSLETGMMRGTTLTLFWFDESLDKWVAESTRRVDSDGVVRFQVRHFSKYAIS